jgi:ribosomal protein S18 acetylase RimI-like enzyme
MIVRLATTDDVHLIQAAARMERRIDLGPDAALRLVKNRQNRVVVAVDGEFLAGYLVAHLLDRLDGRTMALIYDVFVEETFRRQGVGSKLVSCLLDNVRSAGVCKVWLVTGKDNVAARGLYASQGGVADDGQRLYWFKGA